MFCRPAATPLTVSSSSRCSRSRCARRAVRGTLPLERPARWCLPEIGRRRSSRQISRRRSSQQISRRSSQLRERAQLQVGQRVHVRVAQRDRPGQHRPVGQQPVVPGDRQHQPPGQVVLGQHRGGQVVPAAERQVAGGDPAVGLGQAHLGVVQQHGEQRPAPVGRPDPGQPAGPADAPRPARCPGRTSPAGSAGSAPRRTPTGSPAGRPGRRRGARPAAPGRPGPDPQPADLLQRADPGEPLGEPVGLDQRPVGAQRRGSHPVGQRPEPRPRRGRVALAGTAGAEASSTAEVTCSRWRWAMTGCRTGRRSPRPAR